MLCFNACERATCDVRDVVYASDIVAADALNRSSQPLFDKICHVFSDSLLLLLRKVRKAFISDAMETGGTSSICIVHVLFR